MLQKLVAILMLPISLGFLLFEKEAEVPMKYPGTFESEPAAAENQTFDKIEGDNLLFYIRRPSAEKLDSVSSADFGMSPELPDNTDALNSAFAYMKNNPGTKLVIEPGVYYFSRSDAVSLRNVKTGFVDGKGATFIFGKPGTFLQISGCSCLEINGLTVNVDREKDPVDDVARVRSADSKKHTLELVFFEKENADENMIFSAITQCDPESLTFGARLSSRENYIYQNPEVIKSVEKTGKNVLKITHDGAFDSFCDGETYILRHHVYDGQVIALSGASRDVTFDGIKIYGSYGSGIVPSDLTSHYQIINSVIGVDPEDKTGAHVSQGADGIHIVNTGGFFNLENCDISGQGDDALNIHDGLGYISGVSGNTVSMYSSQGRLIAGESLAFKDSGFDDTGFTAKIVRAEQSPEDYRVKTVTLDRDVSADVKPGFIAYNTLTNSGNYVLRNNYIHENRARGFLLQSDNGTCENNRFYKTEGQAIKVVMDIIPSLWQEGTGVNNLVIRNNVFEKCDYSGWGEQITIDTNIDGHRAETAAFKNIYITGNSFSDFDRKVIYAWNVNNLVFENNRIDARSSKNRIEIRDYCENVHLSGNEFTGKKREVASVIKGNFRSFAKYNGFFAEKRNGET